MSETPWLRIDDRLVHGQVVEGWLPHLRARRILVVSDAAAADETQRLLMRISLPDHLELDVLSVDAAVERLAEITKKDGRLLILTPSPHEALALVKAGLKVPSVNVGGMHHAVGRMMVGRAIFLAEEDRKALKELAAAGVQLDARAVPAEKGIPLAQMLLEAK
jgi:PTS system mannose-specific IIB component